MHSFIYIIVFDVDIIRIAMKLSSFFQLFPVTPPSNSSYVTLFFLIIDKIILEFMQLQNGNQTPSRHRL